MLDKNEIEQMAMLAKENLKKQAEAKEENEDIYKDLRENSGLYDSDNYNNNHEIQNIPSQDDYDNYGEYNVETYPEYNTQPEYEISNYQEPLFENGPTKSLLDSWKKQWEGYGIFIIEIAETTFIFRTLNRFEYKQIVALQNIDALQREEIICETVTLWPQLFNWQQMAVGMAGIPSTYAEIIMNKSGFTKDYSIQVL